MAVAVGWCRLVCQWLTPFGHRLEKPVVVGSWFTGCPSVVLAVTDKRCAQGGDTATQLGFARDCGDCVATEEAALATSDAPFPTRFKSQENSKTRM
jgi:hypothetical protein